MCHKGECNMIECKKLHKEYKNKSIITNTNITILDNKVSFIMGKNGAGKTTLIKCLMKMESYDGSITFDGKDVDVTREECLVLWDDCPFYIELNGLDNLDIFCENKVSKNKLKHIAENYIGAELLKAKVKTYSYGQKKKLALVMARILKPKYLIMDEISNGLDYESIGMLRDELEELSKTSTILLTGHQFDFYNSLIDDVFIFQDKSIVLYKRDIKNTGERLEKIYDDKIR